MVNWKEIKANRIQTFDKEIWLYDSAGDISVKVEVPSRPWTKLDPDFTHWAKVSVYNPEEPPTFNPDGKVNVELVSAARDFGLDDEFLSGLFP